LKIPPGYDGGILDCDIVQGTLKLGIEWTTYPPLPRQTDYWLIEVEAEKIIWRDELNGIELDVTNLCTTNRK
jgi:hypothetical protein